MASGSLSPRQKMINMMYLVLTALLALNVSKEVLNSFFEQFQTTEKRINVTEKKINEIHTKLANATNQERVKPYKDLVYQIKPEADELSNFIQEMKYSLVLKTDGEVFLGPHQDKQGEDIEDNMFTKPYSDLDSTDLYIYDPGYDTNGVKKMKLMSFLNAKDDRQSSGNVFNPDNKPNLPRIDGEGKATQLKNKMLSYKGFLINILETAKDSNLIPIRNYDDLNSLIEEINVTIDIPDEKYGKQGNKRTWEYHNFYDMPAVATLNFLATQQDIVKNLQERVIRFIESNSDAATLKFGGAEATTIASSTVILKGDEFTSKIFISAFDNSANPEILIGDYELDENGEPIWDGTPEVIPVENGKGTFTRKGTRVGPQTYKGLIKILQDDGDQYYPFEGEYLVADKSYTISPTKMNVVYIGLDNPISVSVAGYQPDQLSVSCKGCKSGGFKTVSKKEGTYTVDPDKTKYKKNITISIKVKGTDKIQSQTFKPMEFRVMKVPSPDVKLGSIKRRASVQEIMGASLSARLNNFPFEGLGFRVNKFTITCTGEQEKSYECTGNEISSKAIKNIKRLGKGGFVTISDVYVQRRGQKPEPVDQYQQKIYIK